MEESPVRIALIGCTGLLGDVIRQTLTYESGVRVVAELSAPPDDLEDTGIDADILLWNDADEQRVSRWISSGTLPRHPRVLAITTDGQQAALWELLPHRTELGELSPQRLVDIVRAARGRGATQSPPSMRLDTTSRSTP